MQIVWQGSEIQELVQIASSVDVVIALYPTGEYVAPALDSAILFISEEPFRKILTEMPFGRAWGVLRPDYETADLEAAILALSRGMITYSPTDISIENSSANRKSEKNSMPENKITPREMEVLQMIADGLLNKEISSLLSISENTVKFHIASLYTKLGAQNRVEAIRRGLAAGLLDL